MNQQKNWDEKVYCFRNTDKKKDFELINGDYDSRKVSKWEKDLIKISNENKDFIYLDGFRVLESNKEKYNYQELFLSCDGHWSPLGASLSADLINRQL